MNNKRQGRGLLLAVMGFSIVNLFSIAFLDSYFLFSSFFATRAYLLGYTFSQNLQNDIFTIAGAGVAILSLVPYLLSYIFSKKHNGWMIVGLVFFALDTIYMFYYIFSFLSVAGLVSYLVDIVAHIYILVMLIVDVVDRYKHPENDESVVPSETVNSVDNTAESPFDEASANVCKQVVVRRKNSFYGCAVPFSVMVDGKKVSAVKNGATVTVDIPSNANVLYLQVNGVRSQNINLKQIATESIALFTFMESGMWSSTLQIVADNGQV